MLSLYRIILLLLFFYCSLQTLQAQAWLGGNSMPVQSNSLFDITYDGIQFVAVGDFGSIITSPDGINWMIQTSGTSKRLIAITWNGIHFIAVGQAGTILSSLDAITWVDRSFATGAFLFDVIWSGTQFVTVGTGGIILTSPNGFNWIPRLSGTVAQLSGIVWNGTQFVTVGYDAPTILTSPDAINWTLQTSGITGWLSSIVWSGAQFIAVGGRSNTVLGMGNLLLTSPDGTTWTSQVSMTNEYLHDIAWDGTKFVTVGTKGTIFISSDGINWLSQISNTLFNLSAVTNNGAQFVIVGNSGVKLHSGISITNQNIVLDFNGINVKQINTIATTPFLTYVSSNPTVVHVSNTGLVSLPNILWFPLPTIGTSIITITDVYSNTDTVTVQVTDSLSSFFINGNYTPMITAPLSYIDSVVSPTTGIAKTDTRLTAIFTAAFAIDTEDGDVTTRITNNAPAVFPAGQTTIITFSVTDSYGHTSLTTASVNISITFDVSSPLITVNGNDPYTFEVGLNYLDPLATVTDNVDVTHMFLAGTSNVNSSTVGKYNVTYNYTDTAGNIAATVVRDVYVQDTTAPVFINAPLPDVTFQAATPASNIILTTPTAVDLFLQNISHNAPPSFPLGTTIVTWVAIDSNGNLATTNQNIMITALPDINAPSTELLNNTTFSTASVLKISTNTTANTIVSTVNGATFFPIGIKTISVTETNSTLNFNATDNAGTNSGLQSTLNNPIGLVALQPDLTIRQPKATSPASGCHLNAQPHQADIDPLLPSMLILSLLWLSRRRKPKVQN